MTIHPIHNDGDHAAALARVDAIWGAVDGTPAADELEILVTLLADYEARHQPILPPDPLEAIRFRMDQMGLTRKELQPMLGGPSRVSEILNGKRQLTLAMIRRLCKGLDLPADLLIGDGERAA